MALYKVLILANLVTMTLNSIPVQTETILNTKKTIHKMAVKDTISLSATHYKIVNDTVGILDIQITDKVILNELEDLSFPILKIEIHNQYFIAKGISVMNSTIPKDCDYFFPLNTLNKAILNNYTLTLRKIEKVKN